LLYGALFSAIVIVLRMMWMFPGAYIANAIRTRVLHQQVPLPSKRQIFVVGWTGMRGVVALAAAISLPDLLEDGSPFPQRNLIVFLTFSVILVTLVLQGLTLPPLIRALGLAGTKSHETEEEGARKAMVEAALAHIEKARKKDGDEFEGVYKDFSERYRHRLAKLTGTDEEGIGANPAVYARYMELGRELVRVERRTAVKLRNEGRINDEVLRKVERELDLSESRLALM
jgi:CPA1 family monovalent cation:H+ antiporter